jgi:hypothetical protein
MRTMRTIRIPIKITWTIRCHCGRKHILRKGQVVHCACGQVWRV